MKPADWARVRELTDEVRALLDDGSLTRERYRELAEQAWAAQGDNIDQYPPFDGLPIPAEWTE